MTLNFVIPEFNINGDGMSPFQFYRRGFNLASSGSQPSWQDIILHGNTALTLVNSKEDGLNYLKLFGDTEQLPETYLDTVTLSGGCEQSGTPTPSQPLPIVCNNGTIKYSANMANVNEQTALVGYYISAQGVVIADANNWMYQDFIPVKPSTTYTLTMSSSVYYVTISEYSTADDSGFIIRKAGVSGDNTTLTITTESTTNYIRFGTNIDRSAVTLDRVFAINWMLNQGNAMAYAPYVEGGIYTDGTQEVVTDSVGNTASAERLLAVGDYKDTQEVLSGSVTRNIGIKVLDGTENWQNISGFFNISKNDIGSNSTVLPNNSTDFICSHFKALLYAQVTPDCVNIGNSYVNFLISTISTLTGWKQYLADQYNAGTPVIIAFPLATATTESVTPQLLTKSPVTQTAGSISNLPIAITESSHTVPTPQQPLPINCNNGVVKYSPNIFDGQMEQGAFGSSTGLPVDNDNWIRSVNYIDVKSYSTYTASCSPVTGKNIEIYVIEYTSNNTFVRMVTAETTSGYIRTWTTAGTTAKIKFQIAFNPREAVNTSTFSNIQIEAGSTATAYNPHIEGIYADGTVETVEVTGKNLFNKNDAQVGKNWNGDNMAYSIASDYIPAKKGDVFTLSVSDMPKYTSTTFAALDSDYTYLGAVGNGSAITQAACAYIKLSIRCASTDSWTQSDLDNAKIQLEYGTTATTYEPYYYGGQATAEMLLKVGAYQDIQSVLYGEITRNIGIKVLDGTENWTWNPEVSRVYFYVNNCKPMNLRTLPTFCSHFTSWSSGGSASDVPNWYVYGSNDKNLYFKLDLSVFTSLATWTSFLADQYANGTPVIIVYPLETPTTETVTAQPLTIQEGTNIVEITQASMDNLELEVSYKAGVTVTVTEIENAQLDNSVEVTING